ncbi:RNA recognition motif domain-containing protein [Ditylenchus destructor]|nr:RNA recognition motif domain-containing protein [Ditylenchus destructor]
MQRWTMHQSIDCVKLLLQQGFCGRLNCLREKFLAVERSSYYKCRLICHLFMTYLWRIDLFCCSANVRAKSKRGVKKNVSADRTRVYVGGLMEIMEVTKEKLQEAFGKFGPIRRITLKMPRQKVENGFAFIEYLPFIVVCREIPGVGMNARVELSRGKRNKGVRTGYQKH